VRIISTGAAVRVGRLLGIPIYLHWSFLVLITGYATVSGLRGGVLDAALTLVGSTALFGSVLLHELGHAMAARFYGIRTAHISLYPFGGVAAMEGMPGEPRHEMVVALAGPAVNFGLAVLFGAGFVLTSAMPWAWMALLNVMMGLFNLIPAFPMDGGRVLRALLSWKWGFVQGSQVAIAIGRGFAVLFVAGGLAFGAWNVVLVGGFLWFAVHIERRRLDQMVARERAWIASLNRRFNPVYVVNTQKCRDFSER